MMKKIAVLLLLLLANASWAEIVHLKNGVIVIGKITVDEGDKSGFWLAKCDDTGTLYIKWLQLPIIERERLQKIFLAVEEKKDDLIDAVKIVTAYRAAEGIIQSENNQTVTLKTVTGIQKIPTNAILARQNVKLKPSELYPPNEYLEMSAKKCSPGDSNCFLEVAKMARGSNLNTEAKKYLTTAKDILKTKITDEKSSEDIQKQINEIDAEALLADIYNEMKSANYEKATELANALLNELGDTDIAKSNKDLPKKIDAEAKDFSENKDKIMSKKVQEEWHSTLNSLISKEAGEISMSKAGKYVDTALAKEAVDDISNKLKLKKDEVEKYLDMRDSKKVFTATFGNGTWIVEGGQDGGMDYSGNDKITTATNEGVMVDIKATGNKLQTRDEWWKEAHQSTRKSWLEAYLARNSQYAKVVEEQKSSCSFCSGKGTYKTHSNGIQIDAICPRCHGVKQNITIVYY